MLIVLPNADDQCEQLLLDRHLSELKQLADFRLYKGNPGSDREYLDRILDADALLLWGDISNQVLMNCSKLKFISFAGTGYKNYVDVDYAAKQGIKVANAPSYGANAVAEHALALLVSVAKNIPQNHANMQKGRWAPLNLNMELDGKTVGLIGLGTIGTKMSQLCRALGMKVVCWTRTPSHERAEELGITFVSLDELLSRSDIISLHLPYTDQTRKFLGAPQFAAMKNGAVFINTARAEIVDSSALQNALSSGKLAAAGIDVFDEEPLSHDDPLIRMNNVVLSPHVGYYTRESIESILHVSIRNLVAFARGSPVNLVN
ncbi:NAD(P)-dependent oxidoreductase [Cohnella kolymensis]|uniref:NAD(P)-dependent oxidoreductase n=1 Tax=Cohnella kolymensis TaxID=1590652 RepID=UPI00069780DC|nr:NAD(P)-dependent oxidoreductase [Cohnella kolymensis]